MFFYIIYGIIVFAGLAMMVREGVWSNTLTLINIIISGLVAFGFYSPLVVYLDESVTDGQHTYWLDFAIIWALFTVTMIILRSLTATASKIRLRFKYPIDDVGGPIIGFVAAWVLAAFTLATLHTSPMPKNAFGGKLVDSKEVDSASFMMAPDAAWIRFFVNMTGKTSFGFTDTNKADWQKKGAAAWVQEYSNHREEFDKSDGLIVKRGGPG
jgi:uncharacterized membrane protein required for colicin V production